jgi:hypothetical protein
MKNRSFLVAIVLLFLVCPIMAIGQEVIKSCDFRESGDGCVFDVVGTGLNFLRVDTKAGSAGEYWRTTLINLNQPVAKSNVGTGTATQFTGVVQSLVRYGLPFLVMVNYEGPLPGAFPTSVMVRFTGPAYVTDPRPKVPTPVADCVDDIGDTPASAYYLGTVSGDTESDVRLFASSICPGDVDFFRVQITENNLSIIETINLTTRVTLIPNPVPAGSYGNLTLCVSVGSAPETCSATDGAATEQLTFSITDTLNVDDSQFALIRVLGAGPADTNNYILQLEGHVE